MLKKSICIFLLIFTAMNLPITIYAEGITYYISSSQGDDSNSGTTPSSPFKTLSKIESLKLKGDTVKFRSGDIWHIEENKPFFSPESDNKSLRNTITNYGLEFDPRPKLPRTYIGSNTNVSQIHFFYGGKNKNLHSCIVSKEENVDFEKCIFENDNYGDACLVAGSKNVNFYRCTFLKGNDAGLNYHSTTDSTVRECVAVNNWINGIIAWYQSSNISILNNYVNSLSNSLGAGIELGTHYPRNCTVSRNYVTGNNYGMFITGKNHLIYNNIINDTNLNAGIWLAKIQSDCENNRIINNTVVSKGLCIALKKDVIGNNTIINNIFVSSLPRKCQVFIASENSKNLFIDRNCYYSTTGFSAWWINYNISIFNIYKRTSGKDKYSIFEDPEFISKTDLRLKRNSPCIGRAKQVPYFSTDYANTKRGGVWDLGAFQFERK